VGLPKGIIHVKLECQKKNEQNSFKQQCLRNFPKIMHQLQTREIQKKISKKNNPQNNFTWGYHTKVHKANDKRKSPIHYC
jgi:hypothetical protein